MVATTRRGLLAAGASTVSGVLSLQRVAGVSDERDAPHAETRCSGEPVGEGSVYFPEQYRRCVRFRVVATLRIFRTSVGLGRTVWLNVPCEYVAYGIRFEDGDTAILAVRNREESPSLHEYYAPQTSFWFVESTGRFAV